MAAASAALSSTYYRRQSLPPSALSHRHHHVAPTSYFSMAHSSYPDHRERVRQRYSSSTYIRHNLHDNLKQGRNLATNSPLNTTFSIHYDSRNISPCREPTPYEEKILSPKTHNTLHFDKYIEVKNKLAPHNNIRHNDNRSCSISRHRSRSYFSGAR